MSAVNKAPVAPTQGWLANNLTWISSNEYVAAALTCYPSSAGDLPAEQLSAMSQTISSFEKGCAHLL